MRSYKTSKNFDRILFKLHKRNKQLYEKLLKKMNEILSNSTVQHYKNLRYSLKEYKRVHLGSFVLVFKYNKSNDFIFFDDFDHHDKVYEK